MFGLSEKDLSIIIETLKRYPQVKEAFIFGSRATGKHKRSSDVDIALKCKNADDPIFAISGELNDLTPLPYSFEVVNIDALQNDDLIKHIKLYGKSFYSVDLDVS